MNIPYLDTATAKAFKNIAKKQKLVLATHDSAFHADDVFASALLHTFFSYALPEQKYIITRNPVGSPILEKADLVFDCGRVYDPAKLRFDHHQTGSAGTYENGIKYSSFGLLWKHLGATVCALYAKNIAGKTISKQMAEDMAQSITTTIVSGIDAMDNGQDIYKPIYERVHPFTFDLYVSICKTTISSSARDSDLYKTFNKKFVQVVKLAQTIFEDIIKSTYYSELDKVHARKMYLKAKDKRVVVCDKAYKTDYSVFPEALFFVYPHARGGWAGEVIRKKFDSYEARLPFPKEWGGKEKTELEKVSGIKDARFCHNALFLVTAETKKAALQLVDKALQLAGHKPMIY